LDSQQRFEGPDLQELLAQVQRECGPEATILEANKLRSGGVGGFFTRERFEVIVQLPQGATTAAAASPATNATASTDALQSAMNQATTKPGPRRITTTPNIWSTPTMPTADATSEAPEARPASHLEQAVLAAMAAADSEPGPSATETAAASILELAEQRNAEERTMRTTAAPAAPKAEPATAVESPKVSTEGAAFAEVLGKLAREALSQDAAEGEDAFVPFVAEAAQVAAVPATPEPEPTTAVPAAMLIAEHNAQIAMQQPVVPEPVTVPSYDTVPAMRAAATPAPLSPVGAALACLGLPEHLLPATHALSDLRNDLVASLRWLPAADPLPTGTGSVIAVVGNADHAMAMAQQLAQELGCDEREIVVAGELADSETPSWMQLRDLAEATERRRSWRRRTTPTVVAVAAPLGYDPAIWAKPMLDALEPTMAWGVVSADRKAEDVRAWIDRLGGVDAIALTETTFTVSPATMLQLGIPIARLDGDRADPMRWANLLLGRLAA